MTDPSYDLVLIEGNPFWSGRAGHAYGHLLFAQLDVGLHHIDQLQILRPNVIPHGVRCEFMGQFRPSCAAQAHPQCTIASGGRRLPVAAAH